MRFIRDSLLRRAYLTSKRCSRVHLYDYLRRGVAEHHLDSAEKQILNIGSGGTIGKTLTAMGVQSRSLDVDPQRQPDIVGSVENLSMFEESTFDGIICMEVLEHVCDPFAAASEIERVLKPGGILVGSTPFMLGLHDAPNDYYRFTRFGIAHLFRSLRQVEITARNDSFAAAGVLTLRIYAVGTESDKRKLAWRWPLLRATQWAQSLCGCGISDDQATTGYFFVFEKRKSPTQSVSTS